MKIFFQRLPFTLQIIILVIQAFICLNYSIAQDIREERDKTKNEIPKEVLEQYNRITPKTREAMKEMIEEKTRLSEEQLNALFESKEALKNNEIEKEHSFKFNKINGFEETGVAVSSGIESEMHAAINPVDSNNMVVSAIYQSDQSALYCTIYYTKDFGKTWKRSNFVTLPKLASLRTIGGGDPFFAFDNTGKCYLSWINLSITGNKNSDSGYFSLVWASSTDGGATWVRPNDDVIGVGAMPAVYLQIGILTKGFDKQWLTVDKTESQHRGNLYCAYYKIDATAPVPNVIAFRRKKAKDAAFSKNEVLISSDNFDLVQFASCEVSPNGDIHITFMGRPTSDTTDLGLWHSVSTDGGSSFTEPNRISSIRVPRFSQNFKKSDTILGVSAARTIPCPQFAIDNSNNTNKGNLYISWTAFGIDKKEPNGSDIYFSRSTDNGNTWSAPMIVNNDPRGKLRHNFYSSMSCTPNGLIVINWYDRRNDSLHRITNYFCAISRDGGKTFEDNFPVTSMSSDFSRIGTKNNSFGIGEYNNTVSTQNYAIPFWADGRKNNGDIDIYCAKISLSGTTNVTEITPVSASMLDFRVMPNPVATNTVSLEFTLLTDDNAEIIIFDNEGKIRQKIKNEYQKGVNRISIDITDFESGSYYAQIKTDISEYKQFKVVR